MRKGPSEGRIGSKKDVLDRRGYKSICLLSNWTEGEATTIGEKMVRGEKQNETGGGIQRSQETSHLKKKRWEGGGQLAMAPPGGDKKERNKIGREGNEKNLFLVQKPEKLGGKGWGKRSWGDANGVPSAARLSGEPRPGRGNGKSRTNKN